MIDVETTDAVEVGKINDNNFDSSIVTAIDKLVGLHNGEVKVTNSGSRKTAVSARVKMNKLVRDVDTERIRVKTLVVDVVTKIAEVETAKLNPIIKNYTTAIDGYDTKIKADKDKVLADAKDLLDGRLSKLDGLVSEVELKFVDVAGMDSVVFDEFVKMRESIKAHVDVVAIDTPPAIEEVVDTPPPCSAAEEEVYDEKDPSIDYEDPITESEVIDGDALVLTGEEAQMIVSDDHKDWSSVHTRIVDTRRWSTSHEGVFEHLPTNKLYEFNWSNGSTESQDERPYERCGTYDKEVALCEVVESTEVVTVYVLPGNEVVVEPDLVVETPNVVLTDIKLINTDEVAAFGMLVTRLKTLKPVAAAISTTEGIAMMDRVDDFIEMIERSIGG